MIDGERRLRAVKLAGLSEIEANVRPALNGTGKRERAILALVANLQRADLTPLEEGRAFEDLRKEGLSYNAIAHRVAKSTVYVVSRIALLELPAEGQDLVDGGLFPVDQRAVKAVLSLPEDARARFMQKIARPNLPIKTVQEAAGKYRRRCQPTGPKEMPALHFSVRKVGRPNLPNWDALHQLGEVPPWEAVRLPPGKPATAAPCAIKHRQWHAGRARWWRCWRS